MENLNDRRHGYLSLGGDGSQMAAVEYLIREILAEKPAPVTAPVAPPVEVKAEKPTSPAPPASKPAAKVHKIYAARKKAKTVTTKRRRVG